VRCQEGGREGRETTHTNTHTRKQQEREDGGSAVKRSGVHIVAHASERHERVVERRSRQATQACCRQLDVCTHPRRPRRLHLLVSIFSTSFQIPASRSKLIFQSFCCCCCCCSLSLYCNFCDVLVLKFSSRDFLWQVCEAVFFNFPNKCQEM
jgi:hypothetical protein